MKTAHALITLSIIGGMTFAPYLTRGDTVTWLGTANTSWTEPSNWDPFIPGTGDDVVFDNAALGNLATDLGTNFNLGSLTILDPPSGPVSITKRTIQQCGVPTPHYVTLRRVYIRNE